MGTKKNPLSLYGNSKAILKEAIQTNEILAEMAGENYEPEKLPLSSYDTERRSLAEAKKRNELLQKIADGGGGGDVKNIAPAYDSTATYSVGDYVIYDDYLYTAVEDIDTPEDFDPEKWEKVKLGEEVAKKANSDGYYEQMGVGLADQLNSSVLTTDSGIFEHRKSGGSLDVGKTVKIKKYVGVSIPYNQYVGPDTIGATKTEYGVTFTNNGDGSVTLTGSYDTTSNAYTFLCDATNGLPSDCVYLIWGANTTNAGSGYPSGGCNLFCSYSASGVSFAKQIGQTPIIINPSSGSSAKWFLKIQAGPCEEYNDTIWPQCVNLTQVFGDSIASYLYTKGASFAYETLCKFIPEYKGYVSRTLNAIKLSAVSCKVNTRFNQYNPDTDSAELLGGNEYQIVGTHSNTLSVSWCDGTTGTITLDSSGKFVPNMNGVMTDVGGDTTSTCIHLVLDGERDDEWEEYEEYSYPVTPTEMNGILVLDANNNIVADGDEYAPDGTFTKKFEKIVLDGSESWVKTSSSTETKNYHFSDSSHAIDYYVSDKATSSAWANANVSSSTTEIGFRLLYSSNAGKQRFCIKLPETYMMNARDFKSWLSNHPVTVIAKLSESNWSVSQKEPFPEEQRIDNWGTEKFLPYEESDAQSCLVCQEASYTQDLKGKVESAPDSPQTDGVYLMKRENGVNTYVPFADSIPETPSDNGTYVLTATVSGDTTKTTTLSWEAAT